MKRHRKHLTLLALCLAAALLLSVSGDNMIMFAEGLSGAADASAQTELDWQPELDEQVVMNTEGDLSPEELLTAVLEESDIPEIVSEVQLRENDHVKRLYEQETDLYSVIFQNRDGNKTLYTYAEPVKYIDGDGSVKDKSNKLTSVIDKSEYTADYGYTNKDNDVRVYFPKRLDGNEGILLEHEGIRIEVSPAYSKISKELLQKRQAFETENAPELLSGKQMNIEAQELEPVKDKAEVLAKSAAAEKKQVTNIETQEEKQAVEYSGVFGPNTILRYSPLFGGFKEDIILTENIGSNEFSFNVNIGKLQMAESESGGIKLIDELTGEVKAEISPVYVYDSLVKETTLEIPHYTYDNELFFEKLDNEGNYRITIKVSEEFLNDENTAYPVYIDPSYITVGTGGSGTSKAIQDLPVYSGRRDKNHGSSMYNHIGYVDGTYQTGRLLVKFPGLLNNSTFSSMPKNNIIRVNYYTYDVTGGSTKSNIYAYIYYGSSWTESTGTCSSIGWNSYTCYLDSVYESGSGMRDFNITYAARAWKSGTYSGDKGIMLKNISSETNSAYNRQFASTEYSHDNSRLPYIKLEYSSLQGILYTNFDSRVLYKIDNLYSGNSLAVENMDSDISSGENLIHYPFTYNSYTQKYSRWKQTFRFISAGNSTFKIKPGSSSENSNLVLTVDNDHKIKVRPDTSAENQKWYLSYGSSGVLIVNKAYENECLSVNNNPAGGGQIFSSTTTNYWKLVPLNTFYLKCSFDDSYISEFSDESTSERREMLKSHMKFAAEIYKKYFNINLVISNIYYEQSPADLCTEPNQHCSHECCGSICDSDVTASIKSFNGKHHKNIRAINNWRLAQSRNENEILIGCMHRNENTMCSSEYDSAGVLNHEPSNDLGVTPIGDPTFTMVRSNISTTAGVNIRKLSGDFLFTHELAHVIGIEDYYDAPNDSTHKKDSEMLCIMDRFHPDQLKDFLDKVKNNKLEAFCDSCVRNISGKLNRLYFGKNS